MPEIIDINTLFGPHPAAASDLSLDDLNRLMGRHSVTLCCTLSTIGLLLDHNAGNSTTRSACAESQSLAPVATVNPVCFFGDGDALSRFREDGFKMVRFFPTTQGWDVDFAPFGLAASTLGAEKLPIMVDIDHPGLATRTVERLSGHSAPVILSGVTDQTLSEAIVLMRLNANVYVETSSLLAAGAIKLAAESVGAERLLYGSGAPARPMASPLAALEFSGLDAEQRRKISFENAKLILGI